ncbi:helix-turn-helix domain-containing protein [Nocardia gamkensis]|uniref:helix-turn-helix domain-containing protein n=1 Tax=Nocardia gamkensis TaxID=352869 RepID=UPI0036E76B77
MDVAGGYSKLDTFQKQVKKLRNCLVTDGSGGFHPSSHRRQSTPAVLPFRLSQRLGQETIRQIVDRYQAGEPSTALMQTFGLSKGSVLKVLREAGVAMRNQGLSAEQIEETQQLYAAGWPLARISEKFGVDHTVVRRQLIKRGVAMRDTHGRKR